MSIINDKYKGKYRGASDFVGELIAKFCTDTETKRFEPESLRAFAKANGIEDTEKYALRSPQDIARFRMTVGNMLRAKAKRRHVLIGNDGEQYPAPPEFVGALPEKFATPVEDLQGNSLVPKKEKPVKAEAAPAAEKAPKKNGKKAA